MIIKAKRHWFLYPFFHRYARHIIAKHFDHVEVQGNCRPVDKPVLLVGNHASWWDGFFASYLNHHYWQRCFHVMMQEEQLKKYRFFNHTGAYSIRTQSRHSIESLNYTLDLLTDSKNLVVIFPQGHIQSLFEPELQFQSGTEWLLKRVKQDIELVFMVCLTEYFSNKKPTLFIYLKTNKIKDIKGQLQTSYNKFYAKCKSCNCQINSNL